MNRQNLSPAKQRGVVLVVSLIMLLVMTLIGITSMNSSVLEEKMAGNMHNRNQAFQAAESALRIGELVIAGYTNLPDVSSDGSTGIWDVKAADPDTTNNAAWWEESARDSTWWSTNGDANSGSNVISGIASQPAYVIELLPPVAGSLEVGKPLDDKDFYLQVTARGTGGTDNAVVILQTTYKW